jgi:hypothetical protein
VATDLILTVEVEVPSAVDPSLTDDGTTVLTNVYNAAQRILKDRRSRSLKHRLAIR